MTSDTTQSSNQSGAGPLDGVLVLDFTCVLAGPHCSRLLTDLGANVIKVEPPEGDMTRRLLPRIHSISNYFAQQNCGKLNISLDLKKPEALALLLKLAAQADVILENFRPGVMERMGLGPEKLCKDNPRLIFASISGYGQDGLWKNRRAYAPLVHAEMGMIEEAARFRGIEPEADPLAHADVYAGLYGVSGVLAALYQRSITGRGQRVDTSMAEALLMANEYTAIELAGPLDFELRPISMLSPIFTMGSGRKIQVGGDPIIGGNFRSYCKAMQRPELREDPRFADHSLRSENRDELLAEIGSWVASFHDEEKLEDVLSAAALVMGSVRSLEEVAATDWAKERGAIVEVDDRHGGTMKVPNTPWRFSDANSGVTGVPAYRGEHNAQVFSEILDLDSEEI
ncbi:MAG: CoA transferase, partial [Pseudomonadales bacterium]|nr:CoA transferase [Pseudomonadales bacterium]